MALHDDAGVAERIQRVLLASDFAADALTRDPRLLSAEGLALFADPHAAEFRPPGLSREADEAAVMAVLRKYRRRESLRLIWRDVNGLDSVEQTLAGASALAEVCLRLALEHAEAVFTRRHGTPCNAGGQAQRLVVLALGKLGGGELNFSSDIDLILAYPENGQSDGERSLDNETWFARVSQMLVKLLAEITVDGQAFRVDLRLRPFGRVGRVALSFAAMEQYYQREGRDWERYALVKARPVAGDLVAGRKLLEQLRPFVYRRYLDFTVFAGLREMKALIDSEVARKDLAANLKLGPGGIREIEFIVQLLQLIRGGREPDMRRQGLLPALAACERIGALPRANAQRLREAYLYLRHLENRVQMMRDEQTHTVPEEAFERARLAAGLDLADADALEAQLREVRTVVADEFAGILVPEPTLQNARAAAGAAAAYWRALCEGRATAQDLAALGFTSVEKSHALAQGLATGSVARSISARARARRDRLLPQLIDAAANSVAPDACLQRLLYLVQAVLRRSSYLALLEEQPDARDRVVKLFADSDLLAERVIEHPLLLDDLFDVRNEIVVPDRADLVADIERRCAQIDLGDTEAEIEILQEEKHSAAFRTGLAYRDGLDAVAAARALSATADVIVNYSLGIALRDLVRQHGRLSADGLAAIGYGSLGGGELGFASDLDLVFIYNNQAADAESDGQRPLDAQRYYARAVQRVMHLLTTQTRAGQLYEVDIRLRPDGGSGLLVSSLDAFADYHRERAWVWETQALVRARAIAGAPPTVQRFATIRAELLGRKRDAAKVRGEISEMRKRWRSERDRSTTELLDLKQGAGALLDIEFILQALVLLHAHAHPRLLDSGNTAELIDLAGECGVLDAAQCRDLGAAHDELLARALDCTLDARPRLTQRNAVLTRHTNAVTDVAHMLQLAF